MSQYDILHHLMRNGQIMPELPEVETTKLGISHHLVGNCIENVHIYNKKLRWEVPDNLPQMVINQSVMAITRRAKYLFIELPNGAIMIHLGMSGSLRIEQTQDGAVSDIRKHDHVIFQTNSGANLHYHDPRRFGSIHWLPKTLDGCITSHPLLDHLGPEPLSDDFTSSYLHASAAGKKLPIKTLIMDNRIVVGVGNIYASEALHLSGIHPKRAAGNISAHRFDTLTHYIKVVLNQAIKCGGTTLRDFINSDGNPGYFAQSLFVYGRAGLPCKTCSRPIKKIIIGQRASYYCTHCQR